MTYTAEQIAEIVGRLREADRIMGCNNDEMCAACQAADALEALAAERDGQPIETAPTDGTPVIIAVTDGINLGGAPVDDAVGEARYRDGEWYWAGAVFGYGDPVSELTSSPP